MLLDMLWFSFRFLLVSMRAVAASFQGVLLNVASVVSSSRPGNGSSRHGYPATCSCIAIFCVSEVRQPVQTMLCSMARCHFTIGQLMLCTG
jgi:hypothetical protein